MADRGDKIILLTSGGFDSNVLIAECLKKYNEVHPLYVASGFFWEKTELHWLRRYLKTLSSKKIKPLRVVKASSKKVGADHWSKSGCKAPNYTSRDDEVFLPDRNLTLLSAAVNLARQKKICAIGLGTLAGNPFPDATPAFFRDFEKSIFENYRWKIRIHTPFSRLKKKDVLKKGFGLPLHLSFSCLAPKKNKPCGNCNKCAEKELNHSLGSKSLTESGRTR